MDHTDLASPAHTGLNLITNSLSWRHETSSRVCPVPKPGVSELVKFSAMNVVADDLQALSNLEPVNQSSSETKEAGCFMGAQALAIIDNVSHSMRHFLPQLSSHYRTSFLTKSKPQSGPDMLN